MSIARCETLAACALALAVARREPSHAGLPARSSHAPGYPPPRPQHGRRVGTREKIIPQLCLRLQQALGGIAAIASLLAATLLAADIKHPIRHGLGCRDRPRA